MWFQFYYIHFKNASSGGLWNPSIFVATPHLKCLTFRRHVWLLCVFFFFYHGPLILVSLPSSTWSGAVSSLTSGADMRQSLLRVRHAVFASGTLMAALAPGASSSLRSTATDRRSEALPSFCSIVKTETLINAITHQKYFKTWRNCYGQKRHIVVE